jgi:hypothetical protein
VGVGVGPGCRTGFMFLVSQLKTTARKTRPENKESLKKINGKIHLSKMNTNY